MDGAKPLSKSGEAIFALCPYRFHDRYVLGHREEAGHAAQIGLIIHALWNGYLSGRLSLDRIREVYEDEEEVLELFELTVNNNPLRADQHSQLLEEHFAIDEHGHVADFSDGCSDDKEPAIFRGIWDRVIIYEDSHRGPEDGETGEG